MFIEMSTVQHLFLFFRHPWPLRRAVRLACPESRSPCRLGRPRRTALRSGHGCLKNKKNLEAVAVSINIPPLPGFSAKLITIVSIFAFQILVALEGKECPRAALNSTDR